MTSTCAVARVACSVTLDRVQVRDHVGLARPHARRAAARPARTPRFRDPSSIPRRRARLRSHLRLLRNWDLGLSRYLRQRLNQLKLAECASFYPSYPSQNFLQAFFRAALVRLWFERFRLADQRFHGRKRFRIPAPQLCIHFFPRGHRRFRLHGVYPHQIVRIR